MATDFGKRLRQAREQAGLTQEQLCAKVGMAQSTLAAAETRGFGSRKTPQLAAACGVDAHWLATGEGHMLPHLAHLPRMPDPNVIEGQARTIATDLPSPTYAPARGLDHALRQVLDALANLRPGQWDMVRARLDKLPGHPEMRDDVLHDVLPILTAEPTKRTGT